MKYFKLLLFPLIIASTALTSADIRLVCSEEIDKKAAAIKAKITRDTYLAYAAGGLIAARVFYTLSPSMESWKRFFGYDIEIKKEQKIIIKANVAQADTLTVQVDTSATSQQAAVISKVSWKQWFDSKLSHTKEQITLENACNLAKSGIFTIGHFGLSQCGYMGVAFVMQKMYKDLMYPNTLRWYIHNYIPFKSTIKCMKDTVEDLRNEPMTPEQIAYNRQKLQHLAYYSARQGECICGYMIYKSKQLDEEVQPMAEQAERYFIGYYNNWLRLFHAQLAQETLDCDQLCKLIESHEKELIRRLSHFANLEGETDEDKCMIDERSDLSIASQVARFF